MNTIPEALRYYHRSLLIYRANYGAEHQEVKMVEGDIAKLMSKRTSLDLVEPDLSISMEESSFMLDSSFTQPTLSTSVLSHESKPEIPKNSKSLLKALKSKTCVIL
jgi:hypothetical protein